MFLFAKRKKTSNDSLMRMTLGGMHLAGVLALGLHDSSWHDKTFPSFPSQRDAIRNQYTVTVHKSFLSGLVSLKGARCVALW